MPTATHPPARCNISALHSCKTRSSLRHIWTTAHRGCLDRQSHSILAHIFPPKRQSSRVRTHTHTQGGHLHGCTPIWHSKCMGYISQRPVGHWQRPEQDENALQQRQGDCSFALDFHTHTDIELKAVQDPPREYSEPLFPLKSHSHFFPQPQRPLPGRVAVNPSLPPQSMGAYRL